MNTADTRSSGTAASGEPSISGLLSNLSEDVGGLISTEVHLAKAEVGESLKDVKAGVASLAIGAVVLFAGLMVLLNGLARTLEAMTQMQSWLSFLIVGGVVTVIGAVLLMTSKSKLSADSLSLNRTGESLRRDQQVAKQKLS